MEAKMMYSGIDLHSNNSVVAVIDEGDHVVAQKRLPNDLTKIIGFLARWKDQLAGVVVESTYNWYWLIDGLQEAGFEVHLANTTGSSTAGTKRMHSIWLICSDWGSCRRERSCRRNIALCAIWAESECN
jgi:hypothetical protein